MAKSGPDKVFELQQELNKLYREITSLKPEEREQRLKELRKKIGDNESEATRQYNIMSGEQARIKTAMDTLSTMNNTRQILREKLKK